ncbi:hypothetical protein BST23_19835 [Mycolicibacterium elephantis]|uniref:GH16 domain-containing protein n=1 Tax=Mycolicibacterium elephantis TaxID=81858 RepID=A0A1X0CTK7_9MYCO|nr:glycosyltransferase family 25 protein [Mycolicibacterium elephantis]ORA62790.1 hypothetical protein BST23_19835 [Mycolicibacterium elephantis]
MEVFSRREESDAIRRIYVINLDRKPDRWNRQRRELDRFRERHGHPLSAIVRRFSAVDSRYLNPAQNLQTLHPTFTLADQLTVDPNPRLRIDDVARGHEIRMTKQETAVALSHIEVWKLIANGDVPSALVLEDDVFMARGFARKLQTAWSAVTTSGGGPHFDLLHLAYREVHQPDSSLDSRPKRRLEPGIWEASGYVLTRHGARKLLDRLPARGPIDLWLNLQFPHLCVYTAARPIIEQRIDEPSTNAYSVLPVLSQVGVITREKPLVHTSHRLAGPIIAFGPKGAGLTVLATALSMNGYTCLSDLNVMPHEELSALRTGQKRRAFNAYVNVGSLQGILGAIASANPQARFIDTSQDDHLRDVLPRNRLHLPVDIVDKWATLSDFLGIEYPSFPYPDDADLGQRAVAESPTCVRANAATDLKFDRSPWILQHGDRRWAGIKVGARPAREPVETAVVNWANGDTLDQEIWFLRNDTFPSNLALFTPTNYRAQPGRSAVLTLREEATTVRQYTSAAIASRQTYLYGSFTAELRPARVPGLITGLFLHRNGPRQEIDIEFLGKDTTKMLVNVYYNPGPHGTRLEYGYRGTPTQVDLGFDAA